MNAVLNSFKQAAIDWRLVVMGLVLATVAVIFNVLSGGLFLGAENLYNIAQQTAVVGIVATVVLAVPALATWRPLTVEAALLMLAVGATGLAGLLFVTEAFGRGQAIR